MAVPLEATRNHRARCLIYVEAMRTVGARMRRCAAVARRPEDKRFYLDRANDAYAEVRRYADRST